jgi:hypothetical protein
MLVRFSDMTVSANRNIKKGKGGMTAEKILTKHPLGKSGKNIDRKNTTTKRRPYWPPFQKMKIPQPQF